MSKHTNVINRVRIALGLVKFADAELLDGTKVTAESLEVGQLLSIVAEDGSLTPAPEGTHETADAYITVDANGVITTIEPKVAPVAAAEVPVAMAPEIEVSTEVDPAIVKAVIEALLPTLTEMGDKISKMEEYMAKMEKMSSESITEVKESVAQFAKAPGTSKISTKPGLYEMAKENTENLGEKVARLKALTKGLNVKF